MASKTQGGFVFLDTDHKFIRERLERKLIIEKAEDFEGKEENVLVTCCDFDGVKMMVYCSRKDKKLSVSISVPFFKDLEAAGALEVLREIYGDLLIADPKELFPTDPQWNVSVLVDTENLPAPGAELVEKMSNLGRHLRAAPFEKAFNALVDGTTSNVKPVTLNYRKNEQIFIIPSPHVVQVIFSLGFIDGVDRELARVFAVEFADVGGRVVEKAPGVNYYPPDKKPDELKNFQVEIDEKECIGFLVFAVSQMHLDSPAKLRRVSDLMVQFRSYILYHLKATKIQLHAMMRSTYRNLQRVKERCTPKGNAHKVITIKSD